MKTILIGLMFISNFAIGADFSNSPIFANPDIKNTNNWVKIKAGSFQMGSPESETDRSSNEDLQLVKIFKDFEIQATVATQAQYFLVTNLNPAQFKNKENCPLEYFESNNNKFCPNNPIELVSWIDVQNFIKTLNSTDLNYSYRLPTEIEWEYSVRAGSQSSFWFGSDASELGDYAWFKFNSGRMTHPVGTKPANSWGIFDAVGNVEQWTSDLYRDHANVFNELLNEIWTKRVVRGGSAFSYEDRLRSARRHSKDDIGASGGTGFRLVRERR